ncbi:MAG: shikimate kinase [Spirochaetes bacterium]|nr:shikimate kinase [Spirochaetota bacterium]MBU0955223.1 shikimate kinase [Spirochaetota bacterium]
MQADFPKPLVLIGFMGCGKSSVGRKLAAALDRKFLDCDTVLEAQFGQAISALFAAGREAEFRQAEADLVQSLCKSATNIVIATGGGVCMAAASANAIREHSLCIWLDAPWPVLQARLGKDPSRPLLAGNPEQLYRQRQAVYAACASVRVKADQAVELVLDEIIARIKSI